MVPSLGPQTRCLRLLVSLKSSHTLTKALIPQLHLPHALFAVSATPGTTQRTHVSSLPCIRLKRSWRQRNRVGIAGGSATTTLATLATLLQLHLHLLRLLFTPATMFSML